MPGLAFSVPRARFGACSHAVMSRFTAYQLKRRNQALRRVCSRLSSLLSEGSIASCVDRLTGGVDLCSLVHARAGPPRLLSKRPVVSKRAGPRMSLRTLVSRVSPAARPCSRAAGSDSASQGGLRVKALSVARSQPSNLNLVALTIFHIQACLLGRFMATVIMSVTAVARAATVT